MLGWQLQAMLLNTARQTSQRSMADSLGWKINSPPWYHAQKQRIHGKNNNKILAHDTFNFEAPLAVSEEAQIKDDVEMHFTGRFDVQ